MTMTVLAIILPRLDTTTMVGLLSLKDLKEGNRTTKEKTHSIVMKNIKPFHHLPHDVLGAD